MAKKNVACVVCARSMWFKRGEVAERPCCLDCRRRLTPAEKQALGIRRRESPNRKMPSRTRGLGQAEIRNCLHCSAPMRLVPSATGRKFCSKECFNAYKRSRWSDGAKSRRADRERTTQGLSYTQRKRLLRTWKSQGRACFYGCGRPADTVDHLIPLARGGTNYEGNLVAACKSCNSGKCDRLPIEFRLGKPAGATYMASLSRLKRQPKPKPVRVEVACYICSTTYYSVGAKRRTCGADTCSREHAKRSVRERYRATNGLPPTWDVPTKPQVNRSRAA